MPVRRHRIPLYGGEVVVCVADNPATALVRAGLPAGYTPTEAERILAWVQESPKDEPDGRDTIARWIVCLRPQSTLNTIAHEAQHLVNFVCKWYGLPTADDDEPQAYLAGWAVDLLAAEVARI